VASIKTKLNREHFNEKADDIFTADQRFIYEIRDPVQMAEEDDFGFMRYQVILDMVDRLNNSSGEHIDLGCGSGYLMAKIAQRGYTASGVDLSPRFLDIARKKLTHYKLNYRHLKEVDLQQPLPFGDNQFNLITSSDVIEHLEKPLEMLNEAHRLLRNKGYFIASTNNSLSIWWLIKFFVEKILRRKPYHPVDEWFTPRRLVSLCRRSGFKVLELRGTYFFPYYRFKGVLDKIGLYKNRTRINDWLSRSVFKYFGRDLIVFLQKDLQDKKEHSFRYDPHTGLRHNHTLWRVINRIGVELGIKLKSPIAFGWPHYAVIEATNSCNLRCPLCPTGQGVKGRPKGMMKFDNFKRIIDTIGIYLYSVRLENWGEPLLNNDLVAMVEYLTKNKIRSAFNTNLLTLNDLLSQRLIIAGLDHIKVSFDGTNQETYEKYRVGGDFRVLKENIERLARKKKALGRKNPFIELQYLVMKHNEKQINKARQIAEELGVDKFTLTPLRLDMREEVIQGSKNCFNQHKDWLPEDSAYSDFDSVSGDKIKKRNFCDYLWNSVVINYDGSVAPCCSVYEPKYDFGNFFQTNFNAIWNGSKYHAARNLIGRGIKSSPEINLICNFCRQEGIVS